MRLRTCSCEWKVSSFDDLNVGRMEEYLNSEVSMTRHHLYQSFVDRAGFRLRIYVPGPLRSRHPSCVPHPPPRCPQIVPSAPAGGDV